MKKKNLITAILSVTGVAVIIALSIMSVVMNGDYYAGNNYIQLSVCSTIIKSECLQEHEFDVRVKHAEDAKFVSEIILHKLCYEVKG